MKTKYIIEGQLNDGSFVSYGSDSKSKTLQIIKRNSIHFPKIYRIQDNETFKEVEFNELFKPFIRSKTNASA